MNGDYKWERRQKAKARKTNRKGIMESKKFLDNLFLTVTTESSERSGLFSPPEEKKRIPQQRKAGQF